MGTLAGRRLRGLDALRGLAVLAVVLHHYTARYLAITGLDLPVAFSLPDGSLGVQLFFIISGYVIYLTLERTPDVYRFVVSRFSRLWPTFVTCLCITLVVLAWGRPPWHPVPGARSILNNLTMMPLYFFGSDPLDGAYWSLVYEILFYALAGGAYYVLGGRRTEWLCLAWMGLALLAENLKHVPYKIGQAFVATHVPLFVIGIILCRLRHGDRSLASFVALAGAVALCATHTAWAIVPLTPPVYVAFVAAFALLVWIATMEASPLARIAPLVFLGDLSYPLYLVHQEVGYVVIAKSRARGLGPNQAVLFAVLLVVALSWAISVLIEKRSQKTVRRLFEPLMPRSAGETAAVVVSGTP
jgi:peptidoglycan/LPS O-acetylase OafA/YrhL